MLGLANYSNTLLGRQTFLLCTFLILLQNYWLYGSLTFYALGLLPRCRPALWPLYSGTAAPRQPCVVASLHWDYCTAAALRCGLFTL